MAFDPCGTRRLDGNDILARLATVLDATPAEIEIALKLLIYSTREVVHHE